MLLTLLPHRQLDVGGFADFTNMYGFLRDLLPFLDVDVIFRWLSGFEVF